MEWLWWCFLGKTGKKTEVWLLWEGYNCTLNRMTCLTYRAFLCSYRIIFFHYQNVHVYLTTNYNIDNLYYLCTIDCLYHGDWICTKLWKIGLYVHFCFFLLLVSHDDYSIDIYSFGICALEVSDYSVVIKSTLPYCASDVEKMDSFCRWPSWRFKPMVTLQCQKKP